MRFVDGWKAIFTGRKASSQDSAPGRELWDEILASVPPQFIPLVDCEDRAGAAIDRVLLSDGTTSLQQSDAQKAEYTPGAFVPKTPWRKPTDSESKRLWQNSGITDVDFVGIAGIPNELLTPLRKLVSGTPDTNTLRQLDPRRIREFIGPLVDYIRNRFAYKSEPFNHGIHVHRPGRETVTVNTASGKYLGLHLDSWEKYSVEARARSLNRVCVNLGAEPRHFLFVNLPLMNLVKLLAEESEGNSDRESESVGAAFMSRFPGYPIVKVRVDPGEAYIAPTDNVIHDASTVGSKTPSITLTLRGWFTVPAVQARSAG
jgi:hypothetical protein